MRKNEWPDTVAWDLFFLHHAWDGYRMATIALELRNGDATLIIRSLVRRLVRNATNCDTRDEWYTVAT